MNPVLTSTRHKYEGIKFLEFRRWIYAMRTPVIAAITRRSWLVNSDHIEWSELGEIGPSRIFDPLGNVHPDHLKLISQIADQFPLEFLNIRRSV